MALDGTEETVVEETPAEVIEVVTDGDAPEVVEPEVINPDVPETVEPEPEKVDEPVVEEPEDVTFDIESPDFKDKIAEELEKYDLDETPGLKAVIDAIQAKTDAIPVAPDVQLVSELADYGELDTIREALQRDALLTNRIDIGDGQYAPNSAKYVEELYAKDANAAEWLYADLAKLPSQKYKGLNLFTEGIADALGKEGESVAQVLDRYEKAVAIASGELNYAADVPKFIPERLHGAYNSLSKAERDELDAFAPENDRVDEYDANGKLIDDAAIRQSKLSTLAKIQLGIDGQKQIEQNTIQTRQRQQQEFNNDVIEKQMSFYDGMRETFTENILKDVVFSADPKMQTMLAHQSVALLTQAFDEGSTGEYARKALESSGINFDFTKARQLVKAVEQASVALAVANRTVDENGSQLNEVGFKKATREFEAAGRAMYEMGDDIRKQLQQITSTGKAEDVKAEVAKIKVAQKARPATKGSPSPATKKDEVPAYKSDAWYERIVQPELEREQQRAAQYQ